jgi:uncharacterized C2H2 Zn-finger protein
LTNIDSNKPGNVVCDCVLTNVITDLIKDHPKFKRCPAREPNLINCDECAFEYIVDEDDELEKAIRKINANAGKTTNQTNTNTNTNAKKCPKCGEEFSNTNDYNDHIFDKHTPVKCQICNDEFPGQKELIEHHKKSHTSTLP